MTITQTLRRLTLGLVVPVALLLPGVAQAATEGTGWAVTSFVSPTYLSPNGTGEVQIDILNTGAKRSEGQITATDKLPPGLTATKAGGMTVEATVLSSEEEEERGEFNFGARWHCAGTTVVTCTSDPAVLPHLPVGPPLEAIEERIGIEVEASGLEGTFPNEVTVSGGGASAPSVASNPFTISSSQPDFGFTAWDVGLSNADGSVDTQAGSHPYQLTTALGFNELAGEVNNTLLAGGEIRNLETVLPPGFFGNLNTIPKCTRPQLDAGFSAEGRYGCPRDTQIGLVLTGLVNEGEGGASTFANLGLYNMVPPSGVAAEFGFSVIGIHGFFDAKVRSEGGYSLAEKLGNIPQVEFDSNLISLWGVPGEASHDSERGPFAICEEECSVAGPHPPFLTLPTSCVGPQPFMIKGIGTWDDESARDEATILTHDSEGNPTGFTGCNQLDFSPSIEARPTTNLADSATGLHVDLHFPQVEEAEGLNEANLKATTVTLPKGMAVNPAGANGLASCSSAQIGLSSAPGNRAEFTSDAPSCPQASKIGTVEVDSQLVDHPLPGSVYLAAQGDNPFKSLLALYLTVEDPQTGVIIKIAGEVKPDPVTGRLTATFPENPQLPFEDLKTDFFKGAHATLTTPPTCATYTTTTDLTPWTTPEEANATPSDAFAIAKGADGGPCPTSEAALPDKPSFSAGTLAPKAGAYSPFVLHLARADGTQRIKGIDTTLPPGLTGKLAGVAECSEAQIAVARARSGLGQGKQEISSPSCPLSSEVGKITVGAGAGPDPIYVGGRAYLAGPYKGAPLSLAIITPAVAGPFDLGTVVVRTALYVNTETAQIHAVSDPIPTILDGIPLDLRSVNLELDRNQFTLNPTSCDPMTLSATAISAFDQGIALSSPFQVGDCAKLGFAPKLSLRLKGDTKRGGTPAFTATLTYPKGSYANIAKASVALPHSEFLDNAHIRTVCTKVQLAASACPKGSIYGHARAITPLLDKPLEGPVYLGTGYGHELPDLLADLNGQIHVVLNGTVDSIHGGIRNRFEVVPDAPVSKFVLQMQGGRKGLLENSEDLCAKTNRAVVKFTAQNGKTAESSPPLIAQGCKGKAKKKAKGKGKKKHHGAG
jgi:hypothetical protein